MIHNTVPTRDGYTFMGWSENKNAVVPTYYPGSTFVPKGNIELFAIWSANSITVFNETESKSNDAKATADDVLILLENNHSQNNQASTSQEAFSENEQNTFADETTEQLTVAENDESLFQKILKQILKILMMWTH